MQNSKGQEGLSLSPLFTNRADECNSPNHPSSSIFFRHLQMSLFQTLVRIFQDYHTDLPYKCSPLPGKQGANVVGHPHVQVEWEDYSED